MTTKITILGQEPKEKELKKIEFCAYIMKCSINEPNPCILESEQPDKFKEIEVWLGKKGYDYDLFRCIKPDGSVYFMIGHFNDGVV